MNYWMTVFNDVTWPQFLKMSPKVCAYTEPRGKRFPILKSAIRLSATLRRPNLGADPEGFAQAVQRR